MNAIIINNRYTLIKTVIMVIIFSIIGFYGYLKVSTLAQGPTIELASPINYSTSEEELIFIKGRASNIATIDLNDRQIFTDTEGYFNEPLLLFPGYNILKLEAEDQFGRKISKKIEVVYSN